MSRLLSRASRAVPILPGFVLYLGVYVPSLVIVAALSFHTYVQGREPVPSFTFANYVRFLADPYYLRVFVNSFSLSAIASLLAVTIAYPLAYAMVRSVRLRRVILPIVALKFFVSAIVLLYGWLFILGRNGPLNAVLSLLKLTSQPITLLYTDIAVVIGLSSHAIPFAVLLLAGSINNVDESLEQASQNLGATWAQTLLRVTMPLTFPGVLAALVLGFALSVSAVVTPLILGGGRVPMLATQVYESIVDVVNYPFASASVIVILISVLSLTYLTRRALTARVI